MIYAFLAEGFEETEAVTPIDLLRRSGKKVITVGVGDNIIMGSHGIPVVTDTIAQEAPLTDELEMIILPGGMPGTLNLEKSEYVQAAIDFCAANNKYIGAICAAPSILGHKGLLKGRKAVCYEGFEAQLEGAEVLNAPVAVDGNIITARGAGVAVQFGLALVEAVVSKEESVRQFNAILCER
ncbi:DJ-1 family glyoxalase III [Ruminococcus sp. XPD3002]|uniref:DJ-1 family glyoxalase III n=1 Tax=Ruminococcus sp. XPD3002 TaxID=1452269 RepID=UPI000910A72E|nr:DJ-1/PfpI family protein [Ruminococcus sp.]SFX68209.1 4-methyl-5(b-hydroxyethyl)-thiazole monophosphate biosynthesis [Ruminococcus flavefaciens]